MRSPWQLIMWKRKQFNKGQTRFENRLGRGGSGGSGGGGGGCKVGRAEQRREEVERDGGIEVGREAGAGGVFVAVVAALELVSPGV